MKPISEIAANVTFLDAAKESMREKTQIEPICVRLVNQAFIKFALLCREYDALYADARRENAEKLQWALAFTRENIRSLSQIQPALDKMDRYTYGKPPQLGEFLAWCDAKPESIGLPATDEAYRMSLKINQQFADYFPGCSKTYSVIKHAIKQIGALKYREMDSESSFKTFKHYYTIACKQFAEGKLEEIPKAISETPKEHPDDWHKSNDARKIAMDAIRKMGVPINLSRAL